MIEYLIHGKDTKSFCSNKWKYGNVTQFLFLVLPSFVLIPTNPFVYADFRISICLWNLSKQELALIKR